VAVEPRLFVHVMVRTVPTVHVSPLAGAVTAIVGFAIVKLPVEPVTFVFAVHTARIRAEVVVGLVTVQLKLPPVALEFCTEAAIWLHVLPPSRLTSSRTVALDPRLFVQLIVCTLPTSQVSPALGAVRLIVPLETVKSAVVATMLVFAVQVARTLADEVVGLETVQLKLPPVALVFATPVAIGVQVVPPSRLTSRLTVAPTPKLLVQTIG
jgi:hypothetical protein